MTDEGKPAPWSTVVESDRVLSVKTGRWYEVLEVQRAGDAMRVRFVGVSKPFPVDPAAQVQVIRGATGEVVDMFIEIMSSGPAGSAR